jgi:NADH-quinone oxidoreductase subunit M
MKHELLLLFCLPWVSALITFFIPLQGISLKRFSCILSLLPLILLLFNLPHWENASLDLPWIPPLGIHFSLKIDALSLLFLLLTAILVPISLLSMPSKEKRLHLFYALVFLLQGLLTGFFAARDLALFTVFWEAMLFPLYFIIALWGSSDSRQAAFKFLLYMIAGSALMLAAVLSLYFTAGTFDLGQLASSLSASSAAPWLFAVFLLAFAVKTPLFPFHAWLPDAYCQAPTSGSILLAGLLSKAGIYGIVRIGFELFPSYVQAWSLPLLSLAIAGVLYAGLAAWMQDDYKRLIAYSSLAHVNFILVGLFVWQAEAHAGAILQAFNHGITIAALFLTAGWLQERLGTTFLSSHSGLANYLPKLCWLTLFCVLSSVALPGLNNFVGEFLILFGLFGLHPWLTALVGLTVILSVVYMLRWMQTLYFDTPSPFQASWRDIGVKEFAAISPLVLLILWIGAYPAPFLDAIWPIVEKLNPFNGAI